MLRTQLTIVFSLFITATSGWAVTPEKQPPTNIIETLITSLPGSWDGQAIETPVGPVDYDIIFQQCSDSLVAGMADLRPSDHYWQFRNEPDKLELTFLSTFAGNREPVKLLVSRKTGSSIDFYAPELPLLTMSISINEPIIDIRVFHHHKPHVHIRLSRQAQSTLQAEQTSPLSACKKV
ncbi:MAG: hypothetical protein N0E58_09085 [Candidatus Thiodiazotropha endolucinida]|uniref:Uncharacterized protein n=1 Tax=Candidatus Thiodiazotropha taylori TaxID=2792791 RepID=A0A9E4NJ65_9GAMM|nr:hypothetical protein [Candidatus Thiodiazotropha taylori]MCW4236407.1 hypothetical protein [Candidatus Thiodiazotropha endolucinida]